MFSLFGPTWVQISKCQTVKNWLFRIRRPEFRSKIWFIQLSFNFLTGLKFKFQNVKNWIFRLRRPEISSKFWFFQLCFQFLSGLEYKFQNVQMSILFLELCFLFWRFDISKFELKVGQTVKTSQKESKFATKFKSSDLKIQFLTVCHFEIWTQGGTKTENITKRIKICY